MLQLLYTIALINPWNVMRETRPQSPFWDFDWAAGRFCVDRMNHVRNSDER